MHGPYHRKQSNTQTLADGAAEAHSGELHGGVPKTGMQVPCAKAFDGPLPRDAYGLEFFAEIPPKRWAGVQVRWYLGDDPGVFVAGRDRVGIKIDVVRIHQVKEEGP